jgi:hypothetical protein
MMVTKYCYVKLLDTHFFNYSSNTSSNTNYMISVDLILLSFIIIVFFLAVSIIFLARCNNICHCKKNTIYHDDMYRSSQSTEIIDLNDE